ncbi:MAG TPA: helix-turn-helix domain-containing protein [Actinomycetota bacterium]
MAANGKSDPRGGPLVDRDRKPLGPRAQELLGAAILRVLARVDALGERLAEECRRRDDWRPFVEDPAVLGEIRAAFAHRATTILTHLASGRELSSDALRTPADAGGGRRQAVPLPVLHRAHEIGEQIVLEEVLRELWASGPDAQEALREPVLHVTRWALALSGTVPAAHASPSAGAEERRGPPISAQALARALRGAPDEDRLSERLHAMGFVSTDRHVVVVVGSRRPDALNHEAAATVVTRLRDRLHIPARHVAIDVGEPGAVFARAVPEPRVAGDLVADLEACLGDLADSCPGGLLAGVGRAQPGLLGLPLSYEEARRALALRRRVEDDARVMTYAHSLPYELLAERPHLAGALLGELRPLLQGRSARSRDLLRTARVYVDSGGASGETARTLGVSRRTLHRRLEQVTALTGWNLNDGRTRLMIALGTRAHRLSGPGVGVSDSNGGRR